MISILKQRLSPYYRQAEWWLYNGQRKAQEIGDQKLSIIWGASCGVHSIPSGKSSSRDTVGRKAVKLTEISGEDEEWIALIVELEAGLSPEQKLLLELRRSVGKAKGKRRALRYVANEMHYSVRRVSDLWRELVYYTAFLAVQKGIARETKKNPAQDDES